MGKEQFLIEQMTITSDIVKVLIVGLIVWLLIRQVKES